MKSVYIVGIGIGDKAYMHQKSRDIIDSCDCLIGGRRMLDLFDCTNVGRFECTRSDKIKEYIEDDSEHTQFCVLVSGDTGFYSLTSGLKSVLDDVKDIEVIVIPAISSIQYFCGKLGMPWDSVVFDSAHGRALNVAAKAMFNEYLFLLTGGIMSPQIICKILTDAGLGYVTVIVGQNLSYENESIITVSASAGKNIKFDSLSVMLIHNKDAVSKNEGLRSVADHEFICKKTPITKREVRTVSVGKLNLKATSTVYDVGAGTGAVSVEIAMKLTEGRLYAIEKNREALELINANRSKFRAYNMTVVKGEAPDALIDLPAPDAVFIGGSSGNMTEIVRCVLAKNPVVNIVLNTITLQSLNNCLQVIENFGLADVEIVSMSVAKSKKIKEYDMMIGQNPIYIISGKGSGDKCE